MPISTPNGARAPAHTCPHTWTLISAAQKGGIKSRWDYQERAGQELPTEPEVASPAPSSRIRPAANRQTSRAWVLVDCPNHRQSRTRPRTLLSVLQAWRREAPQRRCSRKLELPQQMIHADHARHRPEPVVVSDAPYTIRARSSPGECEGSRCPRGQSRRCRRTRVAERRTSIVAVARGLRRRRGARERRDGRGVRTGARPR